MVGPKDHHRFQYRVDMTKTNVTKYTRKRKIDVYVHQDKVQDETDLDLYKKFKVQNPNVRIGKTTFKKIKPFYTRPCKTADIQTCSCKTHVNFHNAVYAIIVPIKPYKNVYSNLHPGNDVVEVFENYSSFMQFVYKDCTHDEYGLLVDDCESGECGHWAKTFGKRER